jgi:hypothetical protein
MKFTQIFNRWILFKNCQYEIDPNFQLLDFIKKISSMKFTQIFNCWILLKNFPKWNLPRFLYTDRHDVANTVCVLRDTQHKQWLWLRTSYSGDAVHTTCSGDAVHFMWSRDLSFKYYLYELQTEGLIPFFLFSFKGCWKCSAQVGQNEGISEAAYSVHVSCAVSYSALDEEQVEKCRGEQFLCG